MAAMAKGDYQFARVCLNLARDMTPERAALDAAVDLHNLVTEPDGLVARAARIVDGVFLAIRRGDADALREPDRWARPFTVDRRDDERFSAAPSLPKADIGRMLTAEAERVIACADARRSLTKAEAIKLARSSVPANASAGGPDFEERYQAKVVEQLMAPVLPADVAKDVANWMISRAATIAPYLPTLFRHDGATYYRARKKVAARWESACQRRAPLTAEALARATIGALLGPGSSSEAGAYFAAKRMVRPRNKKRRAPLR